jgi:MFS family permease
MGVTDGWLGWLIWRFLAGVGSAWVLVSAASLCLARLASIGQSGRAGLIFAGVGVGIAAAGLLCLGLDIVQVSSPVSWLILGGVACLGALAAWPLWQSNPVAASTKTATAAAPAASSPSTVRAREKPTKHWRLVAAYGLYGFGYILPATFLPAQAKLLVADPALFGLAWPLFGLAAALSTVLTGRFLAAYSRRHVWAASQLFMAVGVLLPVLMPTLLSIAIAAVFVGGTFVVITMLAMQEAQAIAPREAHRLMAAMTAAFAAGQLAGPLFFSFTHVYFGAPLGFALVLGATGLVAACYLVLRPE